MDEERGCWRVPVGIVSLRNTDVSTGQVRFGTTLEVCLYKRESHVIRASSGPYSRWRLATRRVGQDSPHQKLRCVPKSSAILHLAITTRWDPDKCRGGDNLSPGLSEWISGTIADPNLRMISANGYTERQIIRSRLIMSSNGIFSLMWI